MFEEVKELVTWRRKGGISGLKDRQRRHRRDKAQNCQAGAEQELPLPSSPKWDQCPCRAQGPHASCLTRLNGEAKLGKFWHQVGERGRGGGEQEGSYGGVAAEMLSAGPERGAQGALVEQAGCHPDPQHEQQENKCLGAQEKLMPPALVPPGLSICTGRCWAEPQCP